MEGSQFRYDLGETISGAMKMKSKILAVVFLLPCLTGHVIEGAVHGDPLFLSSPQKKDVMLEFMKAQKPSTTHITLAPVKFAPLNPQKAN